MTWVDDKFTVNKFDDLSWWLTVNEFGDFSWWLIVKVLNLMTWVDDLWSVSLMTCINVTCNFCVYDLWSMSSMTYDQWAWWPGSCPHDWPHTAWWYWGSDSGPLARAAGSYGCSWPGKSPYRWCGSWSSALPHSRSLHL